MASQPIIFIGMHRSGTSMLGRMLEELGLFVGKKKDENNEALFFQDLNEWLLQQSGARWDVPAAFNDYFWPHEDVLAWTEIYLRNLLASPRSIRFLGLARYAAGGFATLDRPWGWKDPRNTFTLRMWLRLFPEARVLSIERHGVDVAQSLTARESDILADAPRFYRKYRAIFFARPRRGGFAHSPRCLTLEGGFSLWEEYTAQARDVMADLPAERRLALRYEDVLADPVGALRRSAAFCGLSPTDSDLIRVAGAVRADRALAHEQRPELTALAQKHRAALHARGYAPQESLAHAMEGLSGALRRAAE